jgi:hypothetical protein
MSNNNRNISSASRDSTVDDNSTVFDSVNSTGSYVEAEVLGPEEEEEEQQQQQQQQQVVVQLPARRLNNNNNNVTFHRVRNAIVSRNTARLYAGDITHFLRYVVELFPQWLTARGHFQLTDIFVQIDRENDRKYHSRTVKDVKNLERNSFNRPILILDQISPSLYMGYILTIKDGNGLYNSKSSYGNKRSALNHLSRLHNRLGFTEEYRLELGNYFRGFDREITQQRQLHANNDNGGNGNPREDKEAMSIQINKKTLEWFYSYGTVDGLFTACYLTLTWNLACCAGSTALLSFSDISWSSSFDSFSISFKHTKTDPYGDEAKYPCYIYSNPLNPLVCPVVALSLLVPHMLL